MSQSDLAVRINKRKTIISAYENGHSEPPISVLMKMAEIFDVSIDDFIYIDLSDPNLTRSDNGRMKKSSKEYAQDVEDDKISIEDLAKEIGDSNMHRVAYFMELRINELERALKERDPELAKLLKIK